MPQPGAPAESLWVLCRPEPLGACATVKSGGLASPSRAILPAFSTVLEAWQTAVPINKLTLLRSTVVLPGGAPLRAFSRGRRLVESLHLRCGATEQVLGTSRFRFFLALSGRALPWTARNRTQVTSHLIA